MRTKVVPASELSTKDLRAEYYIPLGVKKFRLVIEVEYKDEIPPKSVQEHKSRLTRRLATCIDAKKLLDPLGSKPGATKQWTVTAHHKNPRKR